MATTKYTLHDRKGKARQRPPTPAAPVAQHGDQGKEPAALVQQAKASPGSLTPGEVAQLQQTIGNRAVGQMLTHRPAQRKENKTGLPDEMKAGMENLSGLAMDDVNVHYNSPKPAELQAFAYTHGADIYVAPGQESYLAHEAGHVIQQKQGRVKPTGQMAGMAMNSDPALEGAADRLGQQAASSKTGDTAAVISKKSDSTAVNGSHPPLQRQSAFAPVVQAASYQLIDGSSLFAEVTEAAGEIKIEGAIRATATTETPIVGSLTFKAVEIPKAAVSSSIFAFGNVSAYSIKVIDAKPGGMRIGDILMDHLAQYAKAQGVNYIIAGDVTAARDFYYMPLGFKDFLNAPKWSDLAAKKQSAEDRIRDVNTPGGDLPGLMQEKQAAVEEMAKNQIFIETDTLITNASAKWGTRWIRS